VPLCSAKYLHGHSHPAFSVIYNKSLTALPETIPDDDDDAQEEARILFYARRQRTVIKDRTCPQVGPPPGSQSKYKRIGLRMPNRC